jgi:7-carboxy-7-deazaguanine synthase
MLKLAKLKDKPEIFHAIQGEGKNLGVPSVFIRLSLCNLYCVWCDTDYTWNWEGTDFHHVSDARPGYKKFKKEEQILSCPVQQVVDEVERYRCTNIVITGGEPFVQHKDLIELAEALKVDGHHIEVETNGTIRPSSELDSLLDQYNVSIKLANSGMEAGIRINEEAIRFYAGSEKSNFKFVIGTQKDTSEVFDLLQRFQISASKVYLMPEGTTARALNEKMEWLMRFCEQNGFHFTDRLHIRIHGNKRGV